MENTTSGTSWYTEARKGQPETGTGLKMPAWDQPPAPGPGPSQDRPQEQSVPQVAQQVAQQTQQRAGQLADQARQQVAAQLTTQKERVTTALDSMAQAVRQTGRQMQEQGQTPVDQYTDKMAEQVERVSSYLSQRDIATLRNEAEQFARTRPLLFLAGAFTLGWIGARFFKSAPPPSSGTPASNASNPILPVPVPTL